MTHPYLQRVNTTWSRVAGVVLLLAAAGLTAELVGNLAHVAADATARRHLTSSDLVSALILVALSGFCGQAGYRLAFNRPDRNGSLFSRTGWISVGTGLVGIAVLMASVILSVRRPTGNDVQTIIILAAFGIWCFVLAWRGAR